MREGKNGLRLAVGIRIHRIGLHTQSRLHQAFDNVRASNTPGGIKLLKLAIVVVRHMTVYRHGAFFRYRKCIPTSIFCS
jgi:hypothetical protein